MAVKKPENDYMAAMQEAAARGDYKAAAEYEKKRNQKIDSQGLNYEKTSQYSGWLDNTDYGEIGLEGIRNGISADAMQTIYDNRQNKSLTQGMTQYYDDDIAKQMKGYIDLQNSLTQPFSYDTGLDNVNAREKQLNDILDDIKNYKEFEYNPETDPMYAALSAQYTKNGQRAMQDTIAQMAARTGGLASSYAASAGNQAYANYMSELGGRIPELQQLAYQMYNDDYNKQLQQAQIAQNLYDSALTKYQNDRSFAYGQYADTRNMNYNLLNDMISGARYGDETAYNRDWQQKQWDYGVSQDEYTKTQNAQNQISAWVEQGISAEYIPQSVKEASGWTDDEINRMSGAAKKNTKTTTSTSSSPKISSAYGDVVEELWGETDAAVIDDFLKMNIAAKKITQAGADEIRKVVLGSGGGSPSQVDRRANADKSPYGTEYNNAKYVVAKMRNEGRTQEEIEAYLDKFQKDEITDEGMAIILGLK